MNEKGLLISYRIKNRERHIRNKIKLGKKRITKFSEKPFETTQDVQPSSVPKTIKLIFLFWIKAKQHQHEFITKGPNVL